VRSQQELRKYSFKEEVKVKFLKFYHNYNEKVEHTAMQNACFIEVNGPCSIWKDKCMQYEVYMIFWVVSILTDKFWDHFKMI